MQTKLRVFCCFVASLLWAFPMPAATQTKAHTMTQEKILGLASWYGKQHQGKRMANGERFDRHKLTAACWYFPLGTMVRVFNLNNGKSVEVTITDRGPNLRLANFRIIDLSEAAATELDYLRSGIAPVFIQPVETLLTAVLEHYDEASDIVGRTVRVPTPHFRYLL